ncbi:MAG: S-layer homology domain-containing protein [Clostridia bacterium]|nr:S-layer homology domain-containing protein [Clostridia bacterium]
MKHRRISALVLILALLAGIFAFPASAAYSDVPSWHWARAAIEKWSEYGVINGSSGKFFPDQSITRGEMAVILNNLMAYRDLAPNTFTDLPDTWYTDAVLKVNAKGVMLGSGGKVRPLDPITREEAFCLIARALNIQPAAEGKIEFSDAGSVSSWAYNTLSAMIGAGYVHGSGGKLRPKDNLSRAEAVSVLNQIVGLVVSENRVYTGEVKGICVVNCLDGATLRDMNVDGDLIICDSLPNIYNVRLENVMCHELIYLKPTEDGAFAEEPDSGDSVVQDGKIVYGNNKLNILPNVPKNTLKDSAFSTDKNGVITYKAAGVKAVQGIDVSSWQGVINWKKVAADGIDFAIIRVGFRGYTAGGMSEDKYFEANIRGALEAGLDVGVYFFSQAISTKEAVAEANFVLARIKDYKITYPVVFDWEDVNDRDARTYKMSKKTLNDCAVAFCERVKEAGYIPSVYFGTSKGLLDFDLDRLKEYDFWYARYKSDTPRFYYAFDIWQYTSTGLVDGIDGYVDRNICFKTY